MFQALKTASLLQALPWLLLAVALSIGGAYLKGRHDGAEAAEAEQRAAGLRAYAAAVNTASRVLAGVRDIGQRLADELAASRQAEAQSVVTVREVIHANPDFGAVRRPVELERLRRAELESIRRAAQAD